jgi:DNA-binding response OmpR family regulator
MSNDGIEPIIPFRIEGRDSLGEIEALTRAIADVGMVNTIKVTTGLDSRHNNSVLDKGIPFSNEVSAGDPASENVTQWAAHDGQTYRIGYDPHNELVISDGEYKYIAATQKAVLASLIAAPDISKTKDELCTAVWGYDSRVITSLDTTVQYLRNALGDELGDMSTGAIITRNRIGKRIVESLKEPYKKAGEEPQNVAIEDTLSTIPSMKIALINNAVPIELTPIHFFTLDLLARKSGKLVSYSDLACEVIGYSNVSSLVYLRVLVSDLRRCLSKAGLPGNQIITSVRGYGYKLDKDFKAHPSEIA